MRSPSWLMCALTVMVGAGAHASVVAGQVANEIEREYERRVRLADRDSATVAELVEAATAARYMRRFDEAELYLRIAHGEDNFSDLAGRYSQGMERNTNGVIGPVPLNQAHPILSEKLRAAQPGMLLEPFCIDRWWLVARLERFAQASFDERMAAQMSMELLQEWLKQETQRSIQALSINADRGSNGS